MSLLLFLCLQPREGVVTVENFVARVVTGDTTDDIKFAQQRGGEIQRVDAPQDLPTVYNLKTYLIVPQLPHRLTPSSSPGPIYNDPCSMYVTHSPHLLLLLLS